MAMLQLQKSPWVDNHNAIWIATTVKLFRNIAKHSFPGKLDQEHREKLMSNIKNILVNCSFFSKGMFFPAEKLSPQDKQYLFEHFLATSGFHQAHQGEGFLIDPMGQFLVSLNITDHLQIQLTECSGEIEEALNALIEIQKELSASLNFAFSPRFGFLTADPFVCGTGLVLYSYLHVPALIHTNKLQETLDLRKENGVIAQSLEGDLHEILADTITLHNQYTLGVSEERIIATLRAATLHLVVTEKSLRAQIKQTHDAAILDKIGKAFGILQYSYQLETKEALNCLSLCKLGVDLGWIEGISIEKINHLFFLCRKAHLQRYLARDIADAQLPTARAEMLRSVFQQAKLV